MQIESMLQEKLDDHKDVRERAKQVLRGMKKARKHVRFRIQRLVRQLQRHLRVLTRDNRTDPVELMHGYKVLGLHLSIADPSRALRIFRRARRLDPKDEEIRRMIRVCRRNGGSR